MPETGRAEPKGEKKPMRLRDKQRQPKTPQGGCRREVAVKPQGTVGAPSLTPAQVEPSSREGRSDLLERMLEGYNLRLAYKRVVQNGAAPGGTRCRVKISGLRAKVYSLRLVPSREIALTEPIGGYGEYLSKPGQEKDGSKNGIGLI